MPSTFSPALRLELIGNGEQAANWGNTTNTNLGTLLEQAITGVASVAMSDADYTLTSANGISDEARNAVLIMTGTLSTTRNVIVPTSNKFYAFRNETTGGQSIVVKTAAGTGVTLANGLTQLMYCDGTNVVLASVPISSSTGVAVLNNPVINGFTGDTSVINVGSGQFYKATGGNVGIGTSSPTSKLSLFTAGSVGVEASFGNGLATWSSGINSSGNYSVSSSGAYNILFSNSGAERMRITSAGNVGIGTASPDALLTVNGVASFGDGSASAPSIVNFGDLNTGVFFPAADTVAVSTNGSERARVTSTGNLGVGTSTATAARVVVVSPANTPSLSLSDATQSTLTIKHEATSLLTYEVSSTGIQRWVGNGLERMRISANGNVGIGTASPAQLLDVNGTANISGNTTIGGNATISGSATMSGTANITGNTTIGGNLTVTGTISSSSIVPFPTGVILEYGGTTAPSGWLLCDGSQVSRTTYAALFAVIGTAYGAGNGSTTFNLPDKRDRFGVGAGSSYTRGQTGGATSATTSSAGTHSHTGNTGGTALTTAQMPSHTHTGTTSTNGDHAHGGVPFLAADTDRGSLSSSFSIDATGLTSTAGAHNHTFTTDSTGGGATHNHTISSDGAHTHTVSTLPPYLASNYIIKI